MKVLKHCFQPMTRIKTKRRKSGRWPTAVVAVENEDDVDPSVELY